MGNETRGRGALCRYSYFKEKKKEKEVKNHLFWGGVRNKILFVIACRHDDLTSIIVYFIHSMYIDIQSFISSYVVLYVCTYDISFCENINIGTKYPSIDNKFVIKSTKYIRREGATKKKYFFGGCACKRGGGGGQPRPQLFFFNEKKMQNVLKCKN